MLITAFDMLWKGLIVGILVSAPMGPVGVLCVQRTLNKGRWFGFVTGLGATLSDFLYAFVTGFALGYVVDFIEDPRNMFYLQLAGSIMLLIFGIYTYRTDPEENARRQKEKSRRKQHSHMHVEEQMESHLSKGSLVHNFVTAFFVTISNPLIIFLFLGLFARFNFIVPDHPMEQGVGYLSMIGGAFLWWFSLTYLVDKVRSRSKSNIIRFINRLIGAVVVVASLVGFVMTITGRSLY